MLRWFRFNTVGVAGAAVQLAVLWLCRRFLPIPYLLATIFAVEVAILHNFFWHEAWTWRDMPERDRWRRLLRFHLANGVASIASNVLLTYLFKEFAGLPLLAANLAAIVTSAMLSFQLANAWVFRG